MRYQTITFLYIAVLSLLLPAGVFGESLDDFMSSSDLPDCGCNGPEDCSEGTHCDLDASEDGECNVINGCKGSWWGIKNPKDKCIGKCVKDKIQGSSCSWVEVTAEQCGGWCFNAHPRAQCIPSGLSTSECHCAIPCKTDNDCLDEGIQMVAEDCQDLNSNKVLCEPCTCQEGVCKAKGRPLGSTWCGNPSDCNCRGYEQSPN